MFYFEWPFPFWCEFSRFVREFEVFVIEPDLISDFPGSETGVNAVLHQKGGFFMGGDGFFPGFGEKGEAFF